MDRENCSAAILKLDEAQSMYPKLFDYLRRAGWWDARQVDLPPAELAPGLVPNEFAETFLRSFSGIRLRSVELGAGAPERHYDVLLGYDAAFARMDPLTSVCEICELAESDFVYPIFDVRTGVVFAVDDGRALLIDECYRGFAWTPDPFEMLDWMLFGNPRPGLAMQYFPRDDRPAEFRDFD